MTSGAPAFDALDRLAAALVRQLGGAGRETTVHAIVQTLVPYRRWRDALGVESAEDYELALLRLLAGERGYAEVPPAVRAHCADELLNPTPDVAVYRGYQAEPVTVRHAPAVVFDAPLRPSTGASTDGSPMPLPVPPAPEPAVPVPAARAMTADDFGGRCRYCSKDLPTGRRLVFCPHCGQNLTTLRCPACSTELELGWKFCVTCGRGLAGSSA
jgi:hypothetical protein